MISTIMMMCCRCCFSIVRNTWPHIRPSRGRLMKGAFWPWKVNSYKDFMDRFPCFTLGKIKRLLAQLRLAGFIVAKAYKNYDPRDRSLWYRITQKTAEHYTSLAEATAMQQKSKADSDTMLIYACALMDLDVTVLKAAMIKILQTSTFFPSVAEIRFTAEAMVNFYNKTTLPTPSRSADLISKAIAGGPKEAQLVARSRPEEPDEWMWLSEAEKDDLRYDMSRIDRW